MTQVFKGQVRWDLSPRQNRSTQHDARALIELIHPRAYDFAQGSLSNASNADSSVNEVDEEYPNDASQLMLDYTKKASLEVTKILRQVPRVIGGSWRWRRRACAVNPFTPSFSSTRLLYPRAGHDGTV